MEAAALPTALQLAAGGDTGLSLEKQAALGASLLLLKRDYRFERVWFWGCIQGVRDTYYIAQGLGPDLAAPRSCLYSLNCVEWSLLPPATEEMVERAERLKGHFQGDPSFEYEYGEVNREDDERSLDDGKELTIKEENRLVATIEQIDRAVGIIPRRAFMKTPLGSVIENRNFEEAKKLSSYFHFTEPVNLKNKTLLEKADLDPSTDFMDSLEHDVPQGSWTVQLEKGCTVVVLRSLLWLGLTFYHVPMTKQYGYIYCGTGEKNLDLPFML
ncbi:radial spoke head protein 9 homolog isoform X2 [Numida meleagris]|uniref:radial spoke head protein 9 homolog isoform X2 n=1 Tax=Numida meleagris TaxID=8996 RepID=UPI000B3DEAF8|nr:radial spoke head protein 9 homolog isoform X2 [Numida meleagris]